MLHNQPDIPFQDTNGNSGPFNVVPVILLLVWISAIIAKLAGLDSANSFYLCRIAPTLVVLCKDKPNLQQSCKLLLLAQGISRNKIVLEAGERKLARPTTTCAT